MRKMMFYLLPLFLVNNIYLFSQTTQNYEIWGVWNTGSKEDCWKMKTADGLYLYSLNGMELIFHSDLYGNGPIIVEQGYSYMIKKIVYENDGSTVFLYVEQNIDDHPNVMAKIVMHFIDRDSMWLEVDRNDKQYPTDPRFSGPFRGRAVIFWRERVDQK
jgi:hypothetical protein